MGMKWTKEQQSAINSDGTVVVSAAAGAGKTTVLVERIMRLIRETDIDRMLIVTFTNAAAASMRDDITGALSVAAEESDGEEAEHYRRQLLLMPGARICTVHSFCSALIRDNFEKLGLEADFSLLEGAQEKMMFSECMEELIESSYEAADETFMCFAEAFCGSRSDDILSEIIGGVYRFSRTLPYPDLWFEKVTDIYSGKDFSFRTEVVTDAKNSILLAADVYMATADAILRDDEKCAGHCDFLKSDAEMIATLSGKNEYSEVYDFVKKPPFARMSGKKDIPEELVDARERFKRVVSDIAKRNFSMSAQEIDAFLAEQKPHILSLISVVKEFSQRYEKMKREKGVLDFNDLEHQAIKLLAPCGERSVTAAAVSEQYECIVVDEYQDTNEVQEAILTAISRNGENIFMVGDVKQSIYRFRNTAPELFSDKVDSYTDDGSGMGRRIFLNKNFRSRKSIIDFVNTVFGQIMSRETGGVDYGEREALSFGAEYYDGQDSETELFLNQSDSGKDRIPDEQAEAYIIAEQINKLMDSGFEVYDKKTGGKRRLMYKDIAILLRIGKGVSGIITDTLTACGLPVFSDGDASTILKSYETEIIISFLKITDNPMQDIPLVGVMRSPVFGITDDMLAMIRKKAGRDVGFYDAVRTFGDEKTTHFINMLSRYRAMSKYTKVSRLIQSFLDETGFEEFVLNMRGGKQRYLNIEFLHSLALEYEKKGSGSLYGFLKYIDRYEKTSGGDGPKILPESTDAVTVTTIHKSKGLEYPVVFIPMLGKGIKNHDLKGAYLCHKKAGFGINLSDYRHNLKVTSPVKNAIALAVQREFTEEELRVLYVALTRAREKLILIGTVKSIDDFTAQCMSVRRYDDKILPAHLVTSGKSFLQLIYMALVRTSVIGTGAENDGYFDENCNACIHYSYFPQPPQTTLPQTAVKVLTDERNEEVLNILKYKYPNTKTKVFSKYSVSELKRMEEDSSYSKEYFERLVPLSENVRRVSPSRAGSVIHLVLENIKDSFGDNREYVASVVDSLIQKGFITGDEAKTVSVDKIVEFYKSETGQMLKNADRVYKEQSFNIFVEDAVPGQTLPVQVQGVIDCVFEYEGAFVILDFKTDSITGTNVDERTAMYTTQLGFYRKAVSVMHKTDNVRCYICYLGNNTQVEV